MNSLTREQTNLFRDSDDHVPGIGDDSQHIYCISNSLILHSHKRTRRNTWVFSTFWILNVSKFI